MDIDGKLLGYRTDYENENQILLYYKGRNQYSVEYKGEEIPITLRYENYPYGEEGVKITQLPYIIIAEQIYPIKSFENIHTQRDYETFTEYMERKRSLRK